MSNCHILAIERNVAFTQKTFSSTDEVFNPAYVMFNPNLVMSDFGSVLKLLLSSSLQRITQFCQLIPEVGNNRCSFRYMLKHKSLQQYKTILLPKIFSKNEPFFYVVTRLMQVV